MGLPHAARGNHHGFHAPVADGFNHRSIGCEDDEPIDIEITPVLDEIEKHQLPPPR